MEDFVKKTMETQTTKFRVFLIDLNLQEMVGLRPLMVKNNKNKETMWSITPAYTSLKSKAIFNAQPAFWGPPPFWGPPAVLAT